ncbi:MAG: radical SAM protein [Oscillospiraceae bacterium]|nr:radical SAM protein [Oscillospiraceae bacterium]
MFSLNKFSLIITTRCNLRCKLCCEYVPQNKPFADMTAEECDRILSAAFEVCDHINTLHLTGGGEPFLHPQLSELIKVAMKYSDKFDRLMLFTNSTITVKDELLDTILQNREKILVQLSQYGVKPEFEQNIAKFFLEKGVNCKIEKYYGDNQSFDGWVDFGPWKSYGRTKDEINSIFDNCAVTRDMHGNWRTRDGKVHWCSRSMRGMELGFIPDNPDDYVDLLADDTVEYKRNKFKKIEADRCLTACDMCSGEQGTYDKSKRFKAAEQEI